MNPHKMVHLGWQGRRGIKRQHFPKTGSMKAWNLRPWRPRRERP
jgi:hypothetical protein